MMMMQRRRRQNSFFLVLLAGLAAAAAAVAFGARLGSSTAAATNPIYNVLDFGAVGDGLADDSLAIRAAIRRASDAFSAAHSPSSREGEEGLDEGRVDRQLLLERRPVVLLPEGKTFQSAPINLTSYSILQVDGVLRAITNSTTSDFDDLWPRIPPLPSYGTSEDRHHFLQYQSFLYANGAHDVIVRGIGIIDGQGEWWWDAVDEPGRLRAGRPNLIQFVNCTDVEISGVELRDSPFWCVHPVGCERVHVHHLLIRTKLYAKNADGIDPDSSSHVLIENNDVSCGDDHIAIKAGRCGDGTTTPNRCTDDDWRRSNGKYTTNNVTIRYNTFRTGMGIALGSELSGGIQNVHVHDNQIGVCDTGSDDERRSCGWGYGMHFKTTVARSGFLRNILFENNIVYNNTGFLLLETKYQDQNKQNLPDYPVTEIKNITIRNNVGFGSAVGVNFDCSKFVVCEDISYSDNYIEYATAANYHCSYVKTYDVSGNRPPGIRRCMEGSMNRSSTRNSAPSFPSLAGAAG